MTDDERAALVDEIGRRIAGEGCPDLNYPCFTDDFHLEHCHCKYVAGFAIAAIEPAIRADEREAWERELSAVMPADFKDWHQNDKSEWPMIAAAVIRAAREREEIVASRAERAEAEVERMRGLLSDLISWFPDKPSRPEWRITAGEYGADAAVAAARAALATEDKP